MKILVAVALVLGGLAFLFRVERIGEVCSLTGTSRTYTRYFGVVSTEPIVRASWVEEILRSIGDEVPDYEWVRTKGDTWTVMGFSRLHSRAPIIYSVHIYRLEAIKSYIEDEELVGYAHSFISGDSERQEEAVRLFHESLLGMPNQTVEATPDPPGS